MMNKYFNIHCISLLFLSTILIVTVVFIPRSFMQEYYIFAAKYWSEGLIPWLGFNFSEMPIGIKILSLIPNIEMNCNAAVIIILTFHLINSILLFSFMKRIGMEINSRLSGIILYLSMLIGISDFGISLEPFATFFLILSFWGLISHKKEKNIIAAILLAITAMIKIQILLYIPVLTLLILLPTHRHHLHSKRAFFFILVFSFCFLIGYMGITSWSENAEWIASIRWGFLTKNGTDWLLIFCNSGLIFLIGNIIKKPKLAGLGKNLITCALLCTAIMVISTFTVCDVTCIQILLPINITAITYCLQKEKNAFTKRLFFISIVLALFAGTIKMCDRSHTTKAKNPLLETFGLNYQLQQEIKNPIHVEVDTSIQE